MKLQWPVVKEMLIGLPQPQPACQAPWMSGTDGLIWRVLEYVERVGAEEGAYFACWTTCREYPR